MADITMCLNTLCPSAGTCKRVQAKASVLQSVQFFEYKVGINGVECDHYWPMYVTTTATMNEGME